VWATNWPSKYSTPSVGDGKRLRMLNWNGAEKLPLNEPEVQSTAPSGHPVRSLPAN
jgi:hypothetical protein